jgi:hypothetical protein
VPILVGSFHDLMEAGIDPIADPQVRRFVEALRAAEAASGKTVAYIGGIDLGHVGPEFGDAELLAPTTLEACARSMPRCWATRRRGTRPRGSPRRPR